MRKKSDEALMLLVKRGNPQAMHELARRYQQKLFHFFYGMSGDRFMAEDLVQESLTRLYKYRGKYQEGKRLFNWLFQIARNVWSTAYRKLEKERANEVRQQAQEAGDSADSSGEFENKELLKLALQQLSERDRHLVILYHLKGYSYKELSEMFEMTESHLRVKLCRALKKLGNILKKLGYEHYG